jgi:hypothetical protein
VTVRLTSQVLGLAVGASYTGPLEAWLKNEGYATDAASGPDAWAEDSDGILGAKAPSVTVTPVAAVLTGSADAVNVVTGGNVVFATKDGVTTTVAIATSDTPAQAATKIDTELTGKADAAIVSSKLQVTSNATGPTAYVRVVSSTGTVLANLGLSVGQEAWGGDGRPAGASNTGPQAVVPASDPQSAANREAPYWPLSEDKDTTIANDATHLTQTSHKAPGFDFDPGGVDNDPPSGDPTVVLTPNTGLAAGGTVVEITGFKDGADITAVKFASTNGTAFSNVDGVITVTTPAHAAGAVNVTLVDSDGDLVLTNAFTYA